MLITSHSSGPTTAPSHDGSAVRGKSKAESLKKPKLLLPSPSPQEIKIGAEL